ncbi:MAG: hypothetical protein II650_01965, partial [Clostridia bacterium]|nr:hypothetical protein [Clostridia bacterium]
MHIGNAVREIGIFCFHPLVSPIAPSSVSKADSFPLKEEAFPSCSFRTDAADSALHNGSSAKT